jgi:hypothetical protein
MEDWKIVKSTKHQGTQKKRWFEDRSRQELEGGRLFPRNNRGTTTPSTLEIGDEVHSPAEWLLRK